ncbi:MAG: DUF721 domain-containing protein [Bdellovibrionales bacterium]|nr:DUF721 domain-containing protein [Bdellovibrionales bacterium]
MAKKKNFSSSADVLQSLFQNSKSSLGQGYTRWKLWREWDKVVGATMAKHSIPVGYRKGVLYVWVNSSPRMQEMTFLAGEILAQVNRYLGENWIHRIHFTLDKKEVPSVEEASEAFKGFIK